MMPVPIERLHTLENTTMGYRLRWLRAWNNLTQAETAKLLGVGQNTVSQWERDVHLPRERYIFKITTLYHLPEDFFFDIRKEAVIPIRKRNGKN